MFGELPSADKLERGKTKDPEEERRRSNAQAQGLLS